jgi:hypothetical protein
MWRSRGIGEDALVEVAAIHSPPVSAETDEDRDVDLGMRARAACASPHRVPLHGDFTAQAARRPTPGKREREQRENAPCPNEAVDDSEQKRRRVQRLSLLID